MGAPCWTYSSDKVSKAGRLGLIANALRRAEVHNEANTHVSPSKKRRLEGEASEVGIFGAKSVVLHHGPSDENPRRGTPINTPFRYTWQLQNTGQTSWGTPLLLRTSNGSHCTTGNAQFTVTVGRKLVLGPILPGMIVNLTMSGISSQNKCGAQEEEWQLVSKSDTNKIIAPSLPLM